MARSRFGGLAQRLGGLIELIYSQGQLLRPRNTPVVKARTKRRIKILTAERQEVVCWGLRGTHPGALWNGSRKHGCAVRKTEWWKDQKSSKSVGYSHAPSVVGVVAFVVVLFN